MEQNKIRYLHLRRYQPIIGKHLKEESYIIGLNLAPYGGVTVAYRDLGGGDFQVAIGRCRTDERYERKLGRRAATNNLLCKDSSIIHIEDNPSDAIPYLIAYAKRHARRSLAMQKRISRLKVTEVSE